MSLGPTYRLQLSPSFGFEQAAEVAGHLAALGIEHAYLSPVTEARPGSEHGYDGTDPTRVREELGGRAGFEALVGELHRHGLGVLLDIVPNHLSTFTGGPWWRDVLAYGQSSRHSAIFDIDWEGEQLAASDRGRVLLPLLGAPLEQVIERGELVLERERPETGGETVLRYFETDLPLAPGSAEAGGLREVLEAQHYRLTWWREQARNYRRFFTIDDLVGVRVEDPAVFERTHELVKDLLGAGLVDSLRVDHVDGLADPEQYLERLAGLAGDRTIVVEKILTGDEPLRRSWPVAGTTGYEVADEITLALADASGLGALAGAAAREGERPVGAAVDEGKRLVLDSSFTSEVQRVASLLGVPAGRVADFAVAMPVYRTYVTERGGEALDEWLLEVAGGPELRRLALDRTSGRELEGVIGFQQLTSAAMAKGVEDTAWYRLVGSLPLLEVGGDPEAAPEEDEDAIARLHRRARRRAARGESGLVPGTTHDTKRSADVRARLLALAEMPAPFEGGLAAFAERVPPGSVGDGRPPVPGQLDRRRIAETCLAMAPFPDAPREEWDEVADRVDAALRKGAREAKARDSWEDVNEPYEAALVGCARALLAGGGALLRECFGPVLERVRRFGASLALAQVVLRSTLPGIPDCYQGDEVWNLALVDPDNRRPVDFAGIASTAGELPPTDALAPGDVAAVRRRWVDGAVKLLVTRQCLAARRAAPAAFAAKASHVPLGPSGLPEGAGASLVAFARVAAAGDGVAVALATRAPHRLQSAPGDLPVGAKAWGEAVLTLPEELVTRGGRRWRDLLSASTVELDESGCLPLAAALQVLPVGVLVPAR